MYFDHQILEFWASEIYGIAFALGLTIKNDLKNKPQLERDALRLFPVSVCARAEERVGKSRVWLGFSRTS